MADIEAASSLPLQLSLHSLVRLHNTGHCIHVSVFFEERGLQQYLLFLFHEMQISGRVFFPDIEEFIFLTRGNPVRVRDQRWKREHGAKFTVSSIDLINNCFT